MLQLHYRRSHHHILALASASSSSSMWTFLLDVKCRARPWEHKKALTVHVFDESTRQLEKTFI